MGAGPDLGRGLSKGELGPEHFLECSWLLCREDRILLLEFRMLRMASGFRRGREIQREKKRRNFRKGEWSLVQAFGTVLGHART